MGKAAGIWKKIKKVAKEVSNGAAKAFAWLNTNILQPVKPIVHNVIDMVDESGLGSKIFDGVTDAYDNYLEQTNQKPTNNNVQKITEFGRDMFEYTQNPKRYKKAFDESLELNGWD